MSQDKLTSSMTQAFKDTMSQAVKDSTLTQPQEDTALQGVQSLDLSQNPKELLRSLGTADPRMCK